MGNELAIPLLYFLVLLLFAIPVIFIVWLVRNAPSDTVEHHVASNAGTAIDPEESLEKPATPDPSSSSDQEKEIHTPRKYSTNIYKGASIEKWEYAVVTYSFDGITGTRVYVWIMENARIKQKKGYSSKMPLLEALGQLGLDGWEAVSSSSGAVSTHPGNDTIVVVLKRPLEKT